MHGKRKLIFVGGIHGVGKSTLCLKLSTEIGTEYLSAGKLIRDYAQADSCHNQEMGKRVIDIEKNQDALVAALNKSISIEKQYLVDGHFTLFDSGGTIQVIPAIIFRDIMPLALIVMIDAPTAIQKRLSARDGMAYDLKVLSSMQDKELWHARRIGKELNLEVYEVSVDNYSYLKGIMTRILT